MVHLSPCKTLQTAARELEAIRNLPKHIGASHFPTHCHRLVKDLPGNQRCCDCRAANPDWACVSYGTLVCMTCSGKHRSYGVSTSVVRSMTMDAWTHQHVLAMLEGGNHQIKCFFERHDLGNASTLSAKRYHTKAAQFYKINLQKHIRRISELGEYQGREFNRTKQVPPARSKSDRQNGAPPAACSTTTNATTSTTTTTTTTASSPSSSSTAIVTSSLSSASSPSTLQHNGCKESDATHSLRQTQTLTMTAQ